MGPNAAVIVLLMCSGAGTDCMEIRSERSFETAALCRRELPSVIRRMNQSDKIVSGRCALAADQPADIDPMVTGVTQRTTETGTTTVRVVRILDGQEFVEEYVVPTE